MKCPNENPETVGILLDYVASRLNAENTALLERHMETCPLCRDFAKGQQAVWEALDAFEAAPVSPDFNRNLYQRIALEVTWWDRLTRPFRTLLAYRGMPLAAAAAMLVVAGVVWERPSAVPTKAPVESAQVEALQPEQVESAIDDMEMLREFDHPMRSDPNER